MGEDLDGRVVGEGAEPGYVDQVGVAEGDAGQQLAKDGGLTNEHGEVAAEPRQIIPVDATPMRSWPTGPTACGFPSSRRCCLQFCEAEERYATPTADRERPEA